MNDIEKLKERVQILERIEELKKAASIIESGRKWIRADEGESIGYNNYYVSIEGIMLRSAFMGYGTYRPEEIRFRDVLCINELIIDGMLNAISKKIEELQKKSAGE